MPLLTEPPAQQGSFTAQAAGLDIISGGAIVKGWAVKESTGAAAAQLVIRNGQGAGAEPTVPINLAAGESTRDWLAGSGLIFGRGVFLDMVAGSVTGSVWFWPLAAGYDLGAVLVEGVLDLPGLLDLIRG